MARGYFAIGIVNSKTPMNIGSLWRTAHLYEAAFVFTVGRRYQRQSSDTPKTTLHTPLFHFEDIDDLHTHLPNGAPLVGVECGEGLSPTPLDRYWHPERAVYMLGAEDHGLPMTVIDQCHAIVEVPTPSPRSMNVACAGSILLYDRYVKRSRPMVQIA